MSRRDFIFAVLLNHYLFAEDVDVRLVEHLTDNSDPCFGRVEVLYNNTWGTLCGESWDINDAAVVCRQLNCGRAVSAHAYALFGEGNGQTWLSHANCNGSESTIKTCLYQQSESLYCSHSQDAGVVCSASLVVIIGAVIIAVVLLLFATVIIILVIRRKKRSKKREICSRDVVAMHDMPHENGYEEDDEDDYEKVDFEGDHEDLNSDSEQDYVNIDEETKQASVESNDSEQDYVNMEQEDSDEDDYVNVESNHSEQDHVNVESDHSEEDYVDMESDHLEEDHVNVVSDYSEEDYVNLEVTEDSCVIRQNYEDL